MIIQKTDYSDRLRNSSCPETEHNPGTEAGKSNGKDSDSPKPDAKRQVDSAPFIDNTRLIQEANEKVLEVRKLFGKNLTRIRKSTGYSQTALSHDIDMTHNFINELEQGTKGASFETLSKLSLILRTPVHEFFKSSGKEPSEDFRYSDPINQIVDQLHETIDLWNTNRASPKNR
jgi:transcriptional regulator with XRE-family HTH domain